jgi:hypothetical protein
VDVTHAGRYFDSENLFLEIILLWPESRDRVLERRILESAGPPVRGGRPLRWKAMGMDVEIGPEFGMNAFESTSGRTVWTFVASGSPAKELTVRRLGMPGMWMKPSLSGWLARQAGPANRASAPVRSIINGHDGAVAQSGARLEGLARFGSRRLWRLDQAWLCPGEAHAYHVTYCCADREQPPDAMPPGVAVNCCRSGANLGSLSKEASEGGPGAVDEGKKTTPAVLLRSIPVPNTSARSEKCDGGGLLIRIPIRRPSYLVPPLSWVLPFSSERRVRLDSVGSAVLALCDGRRTIEGVVESLAAEHGLTFHEAQVPVMQFLRPLTERGVIAIAGKARSE